MVMSDFLTDTYIRCYSTNTSIRNAKYQSRIEKCRKIYSGVAVTKNGALTEEIHCQKGTQWWQK